MVLKEKERLEKKFRETHDDLKRHIAQTLTLLRQEKKEHEARIASVQKAILDLLGQDLSVIETQVQERIQEHLKLLENEKVLLSKQVEALFKEMQGVPETWMREHRLKLSSEMNKGMLEALVHLVESKSIENHLSQLESQSVDRPHGPVNARPPMLKVFAGVGALLGAIMTFGFCMMRALSRGFPLTLKNLKHRGKKVLSPLSRELESLRALSLLLREEKRLPLVISIAFGKGENASQAIAEMLSKEGKSLCLIDLDFENQSREGILDFLEGKIDQLPAETRAYGEYIPLGSPSRFSEELLRGEAFKTFLSAKKEAFDLLLLPLSQELQSSLPKAFLDLVDVMILKVNHPSFEELKPYFDWEQEGHSLAFV